MSERTIYKCDGCGRESDNHREYDSWAYIVIQYKPVRDYYRARTNYIIALPAETHEHLLCDECMGEPLVSWGNPAGAHNYLRSRGMEILRKVFKGGHR